MRRLPQCGSPFGTGLARLVGKIDQQNGVLRHQAISMMKPMMENMLSVERKNISARNTSIKVGGSDDMIASVLIRYLLIWWYCFFYGVAYE